MYGNGLVKFWDGFECFDGPLDGYANRSLQTSLPCTIGSPTDSRTVLLRAVG